MKIKGREIIFIIGDISEALYRIMQLTDKQNQYSKVEIEEVFGQVMLISKHAKDIKEGLIKLSKNL